MKSNLGMGMMAYIQDETCFMKVGYPSDVAGEGAVETITLTDPASTRTLDRLKPREEAVP